MLALIGIGAGRVAALFEVALVRTYQKNVIVLVVIGSHWVAVGALMPHVDIGVDIWLKGILVGVMLTVPFIIYEIQQSRNVVIHTDVLPQYGERLSRMVFTIWDKSNY